MASGLTASDGACPLTSGVRLCTPALTTALGVNAAPDKDALRLLDFPIAADNQKLTVHPFGVASAIPFAET